MTAQGWKTLFSRMSRTRLHFKNIDTDNLIYDFHLSDKSAAIDKADNATSPVDDHDGIRRDEKPDIGAYENTKKETK